MEGKRSSNKSQGNYFTWVLSIMLLGLMRMVKGEEVKVANKDEDLGQRLVETTENLDMGSKKLGKMPTGDIIFLVLCLLVLICFMMATIVNLVVVSSEATISLLSLGLITLICLIGIMSVDSTKSERDSDEGHEYAIYVYSSMVFIVFLYYGYCLGIYNAITRIFNSSVKKENVSNSKVKDPVIRSHEYTE
ncbi:olfactory receptor 4N4-like, putative [Babesia ovis]|uniref:Olfactory receptor 4N4-like, putative n=1 Tax=Babesia ovis TaxID=5869 RepID=A0A9W5TDB0_BABOV|nr:olfactory receptor 4N4-like, putative [Babesia ovis]